MLNIKKVINLYLENAKALDKALEKSGGMPQLTHLHAELPLRDFLIILAQNNVRLSAKYEEVKTCN